MLTITQMREKIAALMKQLGEIRANATNENRELNDEERVVCSQLLDEVEGLDAGADDYITKPVEPQRLTMRVEKLVERCSLRKA